MQEDWNLKSPIRIQEYSNFFFADHGLFYCLVDFLLFGIACVSLKKKANTSFKKSQIPTIKIFSWLRSP